jgi:hypothetical protein
LAPPNHAGEIFGERTLPAGAGLALQPVHEVDDGIEAPPGAAGGCEAHDNLILSEPTGVAKVGLPMRSVTRLLVTTALFSTSGSTSCYRSRRREPETPTRQIDPTGLTTTPQFCQKSTASKAPADRATIAEAAGDISASAHGQGGPVKIPGRVAHWIIIQYPENTSLGTHTSCPEETLMRSWA